MESKDVDRASGKVREFLKRVLRRMFRRRGLDEARLYVGTDEVSGQQQLALLRREGCVPESFVLEVGCGCLNAGLPVIRFLQPARYVGIDPNAWLRQAVLKDRAVRQLIRDKQPRFLSVDDFDASRLGVAFDFAFSHSVLSHCAHWQLERFLRKVSLVMKPDGRILASIRLAEGNRYGSCGTADKQDSRHDSWQYPGVSWFSFPTVVAEARKAGLTAHLKPEYTELLTRTHPNEHHDWIVFQREVAATDDHSKNR